MCTVVILRRPGHDWPLLLAGNRDEMGRRPWLPPARHWPEWPEVTGGLDQLAGGSWLGLNDNGVIAAALNRRHTLGPADGKRSRGELVLDALDHADAVEAARALAELNPQSYRGFNLVVADNRDAWWLRHDGETIELHEIPEGISMLTAGDLNDPEDARVARHLAAFRAAPEPDIETGNWSGWIKLLSLPPGERPEDGLDFPRRDNGFGTVSSALIALPAIPSLDRRPVFRFAAGRPSEVGYESVAGV